MADEIPRFSNLGFNPKPPETELTKIVTALINDRMLPNDPLLPETDIDRRRPVGQVRNNVPLLPETDIDRCHPVGQVKNNVPSQIIGKFASYQFKHLRPTSTVIENVVDHTEWVDCRSLHSIVLVSIVGAKHMSSIYMRGLAHTH